MSTARWLRTGGVGLLLVVLLATIAGAAAPAGGSVSASDAGSIDIGVDAPETVPTDQSTTATVTASGATGGVDVFELTLAASGSEATIEDISVLTDGTTGPLTDIQYGPNDQTVTVRVTTLDASYENASTISLFDADVSSGASGTVDLAVTGVSTVQDTNLEPYTIGQTSGAQIEFTGETAAPTDSIDIPNKTLPADGGTITVSNQSAGAYLQLDTSELPAGWTVSDPQPIGFSFTQNESAWLYPVPKTVSLNITPTDGSAGQSGVITATVDDSENQDTFTVTIGEDGAGDGPPASTPVPDDVAPPAVVDAVVTAGNDNELGTLDVLDAYATFLETGEVNGESIDSSLTLLDLYSWRIENPNVAVGPVNPDGGTDEPDDIIGGPDDGGNETDDDAPDESTTSPLTIEQTVGGANANGSITAIGVAHGLTNGSAPVNLSETTWTVTTPDETTTISYEDVQAQSSVGTSEPPLLEKSGDVIQIAFGLEAIGLPPLEAGEDVTIEASPSVQPPNVSHLDGVDGGYADLRGQETATVAVGAEGNGGNLAFSPAMIWVDPGTTVTWEWTGNGGDHKIETVEGPATLNSELVATAGHTYEYTFTEDDTGITNYEGVAHSALGELGTVVVGDDAGIPTESVSANGTTPTSIEPDTNYVL